MENPRLMNMAVHKMATSSNGISNTERDPVPPNPSSESQDTSHPINPSNGFVSQNIPNLIRPPLPPPHLPLPPAGTGNAVPQTSSSTAIMVASSRSSGARSSSRSSHRRSGKKGTTSGSSTRSKSSTSSGSGLRPKACRLCGQPHSTHEPHLYNYK